MNIIAILICFTFYKYYVTGHSDSPQSRKKRYVVFPKGSTFSVAFCLTIHTLTPDDIFTEGINWGISYNLPNETAPSSDPYLQLRKEDKIKSHKEKLSKPWKQKNPYKYLSSWSKNKYQTFPKKSYKKSYDSDYHLLQRRHRRDLYDKLEVIMNAYSLTFTSPHGSTRNANTTNPRQVGRKDIGMGFDGRTCVLRALCEASQRLMPKGNTLVEEMMRIIFSLPLKRVFSFEPEQHRTYVDAHKAGHEGEDCTAMFPGCSFSLLDVALGRYNLQQSESSDRVEEMGTQQATDSIFTNDNDWVKYKMK